MRVLLAPDKFKGSLSAIQACDALREGVRAIDPSAEVDLCPLSDGGEGFVDAMVRALGGRLITRRVTGPLPEMKVDATFGVLPATPTRPITAVIEMSAASGLHWLRPDQYDPLATTTFGAGQLVREAVREGCRHVLLGIGGSATCDAGIGFAQACGLPVLLDNGDPTSDTEPLCGRDLEHVVRIKSHRGGAVDGVTFEVAADVTNPLFGPDGAAPVFAPQKGATAQQVRWLDDMLKQLATRTGHLTEAASPGAGAAGGLGFALLAFFGATLRPGIELVIEATRLRERLTGTDLCLTGEGRIDAQTLSGKTVIGVARACRDANVPCVALAGAVGYDLDLLKARQQGLTSAFSICPGPVNHATALRDAGVNLSRVTSQVVSLLGKFE